MRSSTTISEVARGRGGVGAIRYLLPQVSSRGHFFALHRYEGSYAIKLFESSEEAEVAISREVRLLDDGLPTWEAPRIDQCGAYATHVAQCIRSPKHVTNLHRSTVLATGAPPEPTEDCMGTSVSGVASALGAKRCREASAPKEGRAISKVSATASGSARDHGARDDGSARDDFDTGPLEMTEVRRPCELNASLLEAIRAGNGVACAEFGDGWLKVTKPRKCVERSGRSVDNYYVSPKGGIFRSRPQARLRCGHADHL